MEYRNNCVQEERKAKIEEDRKKKEEEKNKRNQLIGGGFQTGQPGGRYNTRSEYSAIL